MVNLSKQVFLEILQFSRKGMTKPCERSYLIGFANKRKLQIQKLFSQQSKTFGKIALLPMFVIPDLDNKDFDYDNRMALKSYQH